MKWAVALIVIAWSCGSAAAENARIARFNEGQNVSLWKSLPEMADFRYDSARAAFERASTEQIKAAFRGKDTFRELESNGQVTRVTIDLTTVPYWLYARYDDQPAGCRYVLVDGFTRSYPRDADDDTPVEAPIRWGDFDLGAVILRDCGKGYTILAQEGYGSIFDLPKFEMPGSGEMMAEEVFVGMARDYVQRLIAGLGGREALQKIFDTCQGHDFYGAPRRIAAELKAQGFRP
ncbi:MAG: hypothetical protein FWD68_05375 [Alphaproteobacteria bacterium]|nr:hypothetical protein [Alphaproteobacteria bacterium]